MIEIYVDGHKVTEVYETPPPEGAGVFIFEHEGTLVRAQINKREQIGKDVVRLHVGDFSE